ncbi:Glycosyltransferase [Rhodovastum atsumiense]|uniref:Glycosyltransferase n=1 Tax=Rhodovastum atsumiense TaxID=504468 RepID=A0A5M6IZV4_9PROT|nr:glycosyltransferase [Rhodovastum atsumiense]KAA5613801.1 glycosyltransferase [Rhodovastum atsumiense]CAH2601900.1 Glycosyltransferase [Rhodovastum atsumiense]
MKTSQDHGAVRAGTGHDAVTSARTPRRLLLLDPARQHARDEEQNDALALIRDFVAAGWQIEWVIDRADPLPALPGQPGVTIHRLLAANRIRPELRLIRRDATACDSPPADAAAADSTQETLVSRLDAWARQTWKTSTGIPARLLALGVWVLIRLQYRIRRLFATATYHLRHRARQFAACLLDRPARLVRRLLGAVAVRARQRLHALVHLPVLAPVAPVLRHLYRTLTGPAETTDSTPAGATPGPGNATALVRDAADRARLVALLRGMGPDDLVLMPAAEPIHLELLLQLLPHLDLDTPLRATLHLLLTPHPRLDIGPGELDAATLGRRLATGCPFRRLILHAATEAEAARLQEALRLPVFALPAGTAPATGAPPTRVEARLRAFTSPSGTSVCIDAFGPVALVVSALWGRVGSSAIFDAQLRHLIDHGYLVVRLLVEHWPHREPQRSRRISAFLSENFENVRPHLHIVAERDDRAASIARMVRSAAFRAASVVTRVQLLLRDPVTTEPEALAWAGRRAAVALVNHLPQLLLTETLTRAPVVLATHDIYSDLIRSHGVPEFVPHGAIDDAACRREERECWHRVAVCANISTEEHALIRRDARHAVLVRPYAAPRLPSDRSWPEIVAANRLPDACREVSGCDILVWGGWHQVNVDGVHWFLDQVRPLHPALANARIIIAGRVVQGLDRARLPERNVICAGFVDRLEDVFARSRVLVIPDQAGTGLSIKAMEALAAGACFASTACGLRGLELGDSEYRPATDAAGLAGDIAALLGSAEARRRRTATARRLYALNYSAEAHARAMNEALAWAMAPDGAAAAVAAAIAAPAADATLPGMITARTDEVSRQAPPLVAPGPRNDAPRAQEESLPDPIPSTAQPRLSVVVCTYNRYDVLPDALDSLLRQQCPAGFLEIVVVDNSADQAAAGQFGERYAGEPGLRYLLEPVPGLSNARNRGLEEARADLVAFIDDDAIAAPDWAVQMVRAFDSIGSDIAVIGGRVRPRWVTPRPAWLPDTLLGYLSIVDWGGRLRELGEREWLAGCNLAFRRGPVMSVGGFNRQLGRTGEGLSLMSNEETAVIDRLRAAGHRAAYAPEAAVEHVIDPARLSQVWFRRRAAWQAVSDFVKDQKQASAYAPMAMTYLRARARLPGPAGRLGIYARTEDPDQFNQDVGATYDLIMATLSGGIEDDPAERTHWLEAARLTLWGRTRAFLLRHSQLHSVARTIRRALS